MRRCPLSTILLFALAFLAPDLARAEAPRPLGGPLTLLRPQGAVTPNEHLTSVEAPAVAAAPGGGFLVAWIQQANGWTTSLLTRSVSARGEVGAGEELVSVSDCRNFLWNQRLVRAGTELSVFFQAHGHHVGDTLEYRVLIDWEGHPGTTDQAAAVGSSFSTGCLQVSSNGYTASKIAWQQTTAQYSVDFPAVSHNVAISTQGNLYAAGQVAAFPLPGKLEDYSSSPSLPCPSFDWYGTAWWTFEELSAPLLRVALDSYQRSFTLAGFADKAYLKRLSSSPFPYDFVLAARRSERARRLGVYRIESANESLRHVGDTTAGDRVLASDNAGRLIVAKPAAHGRGLEVRFLTADLAVEGEAITVPSTRLSATFDDEEQRVLLAWTAEQPVYRLNGGSIVPVTARVFEWRP